MIIRYNDLTREVLVILEKWSLRRGGRTICIRSIFDSILIFIEYGDSPDDKSHGIPVVLVVLEGGPNTIETVLKSVTSCPAVPVVIAEGSGRAANILAYAYSIFTSNNG